MLVAVAAELGQQRKVQVEQVAVEMQALLELLIQAVVAVERHKEIQTKVLAAQAS